MSLPSQLSAANQYHQQYLLCLLFVCVYSAKIGKAVMVTGKVVEVNLMQVLAIVCGVDDLYRSAHTSGVQKSRGCAEGVIGTFLGVDQRCGVNCFGFAMPAQD